MCDQYTPASLPHPIITRLGPRPLFGFTSVGRVGHITTQHAASTNKSGEKVKKNGANNSSTADVQNREARTVWRFGSVVRQPSDQQIMRDTVDGIQG